MSLFHLAINVTDLDQARAFYGDLLGCQIGRTSKTWIDFNFFGHQLSLHLGEPFTSKCTGKVADALVPMPHLGVVLQMDEWQAMADKLTKAGIDFVLPPSRRFEGQPGEQSTMFFYDPCGNPIEIKGVANIDEVFAA